MSTRPAGAWCRTSSTAACWTKPCVIWGGEFGRTIYSQGGLTPQNYGRDHHPRCFTMWMAGGGTRGGTIYGETDDFSYNIVKDPVHIRDFHATVLAPLGLRSPALRGAAPRAGPATHGGGTGPSGDGIVGLNRLPLASIYAATYGNPTSRTRRRLRVTMSWG